MKVEHLLLGLGALLLLKSKKSSIGGLTYLPYPLPTVIDDAGINGKSIGSGTIVRSREINLRMKNGPLVGEDSFKSPDESASFLRRIIGRRMQVQEVFVAVFLNYANRPIGYLIMSVGGISGTVVDPPIIAVAALKSLASGVIISHNHPSGNLKPSQADMDITRKLKSALSTLNINLLDHIIVTTNGYYSFANEGLI